MRPGRGRRPLPAGCAPERAAVCVPIDTYIDLHNIAERFGMSMRTALELVLGDLAAPQKRRRAA